LPAREFIDRNGGMHQLFTFSGVTGTGKTKLVVFEADSLMVPFAQVKKEFEQANPDIQVEMQAHGSIQVIRQVTELGQDVDVVAVADYSLIPMLMYQTKMPDGKPYASWDIMPATNQLVLAYTSKSKYASELNAGNWYQIIARPMSASDSPTPAWMLFGYRNLMALNSPNLITIPVISWIIQSASIFPCPSLLTILTAHQLSISRNY